MSYNTNTFGTTEEAKTSYKPDSDTRVKVDTAKIQEEKKSHVKKSKAKKTKSTKLNVNKDDAFIPYPNKGGHSVLQLKNFPEHKRKSILGEKDAEFLKKYA